MDTVITELYELPRYGASNYTATAQFCFNGEDVIVTTKTWINEEVVTRRRISRREYNKIARNLSNRIKITAGGYYGCSAAYYKINKGQLMLLEPAPTMNLQGNGAANLFEDVYVDYMHDLQTSLVNSYRHNKENCGCHLCGFDIRIEGIPDLPIISE